MLGGEILDTLLLVRQLSHRGVPLYALTNFAAETWPIGVKKSPFLSSLFDGVVVSGHAGVAKPDRTIFELLSTRYGLNPLETAFIDDKEINVGAARAVGYESHHFTSATRLSAWLASVNLIESE